MVYYFLSSGLLFPVECDEAEVYPRLGGQLHVGYSPIIISDEIMREEDIPFIGVEDDGDINPIADGRNRLGIEPSPSDDEYLISCRSFDRFIEGGLHDNLRIPDNLRGLTDDDILSTL